MTPARRFDFSALRIAVTGDLLVDRYLYAEPQRLSREAPVIVLRHVHERIGAGDAANVARDVRAMGCDVRLFGVVGEDDLSPCPLDLLKRESIDTSGVPALDRYDTPTKTRVLAAEPRRHLQQILRIDREPQRSIAASERGLVAGAVRAATGSLDAAVLSDYGHLLAGEVAAAVRETAAIAVLDPCRSVGGLIGLTAMTPSVDELARCVGVSPDSLHDAAALRAAAEALRDAAVCDYLLVTRGNLGMAVFGRDLPAEGTFGEASGTGQISDVCGGGDTAVAVFTLALAAGQGPRRDDPRQRRCRRRRARARHSRLPDRSARGSVGGRVRAGGSGLIARAELRVRLEARCPAPGHVRYLEDARSRSDHLVVALNSDCPSARSRVRSGRGCRAECAEIVAALRCVDAVSWFDEPGLEATLRELRPDIHAKGSDCEPGSVPEASVDAALGIEIAICGDPKDHSTTELLARMSAP